MHVLLALQINFFLLYSRLKKNPFLIILSAFLIFFYLTRFFTLQLSLDSSYPNDLLKIKYLSPPLENINQTFFYIFLANWFLFYGFYVADYFLKMEHRHTKINNFLLTENKLRMIMLFFFISIFYFLFIERRVENSFLQIFTYLIEYQHFLPFVFFALILKSEKSLKITFIKVILSLLICLSIYLQYQSGSRAFIINSIVILILVLLSINKYEVSMKYYVFFGLLLFMSLFKYNAISEKRFIEYTSLPINNECLSHSLNINQSNVSLSRFDLFQNNMFCSLIPAFNRISFYDFTYKLIDNSIYYKESINFNHIFRSLIDGITPGFDLFNQAKLANSIYGEEAGEPDRNLRNNSRPYQSNQLTIYGEYYVLFGKWLSLPFFSGIAFVFSYVYRKFEMASLNTVIYRYLSLSTFYAVLVGFGSDWVIIYMSFSFLFLIIFLCLLSFSENHKDYLCAE